MKINSSFLFVFAYIHVLIQVLSLYAPSTTKTLSGHTSDVRRVAFSPNGFKIY